MGKPNKTALQRYIFDHGLSLDIIAERTGKSRKTVWWAAVGHRVSIKTAEAISSKTGIPVESLLVSITR
jgi:hypothetical protein